MDIVKESLFNKQDKRKELSPSTSIDANVAESNRGRRFRRGEDRLGGDQEANLDLEKRSFVFIVRSQATRKMSSEVKKRTRKG